MENTSYDLFTCPACDTVVKGHTEVQIDAMPALKKRDTVPVIITGFHVEHHCGKHFRR